MVDPPFRIERLPSMTVASVRAMGSDPVADAWGVLRAWADETGLPVDLQRHPVYGFENPPPSAEGAEYGYEMWMRVDPDTPVAENAAVTLKRAPGGRYIVTRCRIDEDPRGTVEEVWRDLHLWVRESGTFQWKRTQGLQRFLSPPDEAAEVDLYLPVED